MPSLLGSPFTVLEIVHRLVDDSAIDPPDLVGVSDEQAVVAERVDDTWNPARVLGDTGNRRVGEEPEICRSGDAKSRADVVTRFFRGQGQDAAAKPDALLELAQLGAIQLVQELWLSDEENLQQLLRIGLEVREEPDLLEGFETQVLGLVEGQHGVLTGPAPVDQEVVQGDEPLDVGLTGLGDAEVLEHVLENSLEGQGRVEDEGRGTVTLQAAQERAQERGLAGADLAREEDEPLVLLDPVEQLRERLPVPGRRVEEARIRRGVEGLLLKAEEREIEGHARLSFRFPRASGRATRYRGQSSRSHPRSR